MSNGLLACHVPTCAYDRLTVSGQQGLLSALRLLCVAVWSAGIQRYVPSRRTACECCVPIPEAF